MSLKDKISKGSLCFKNGEGMQEANTSVCRSEVQVMLCSTGCFGEIPNLFLTHHIGGRECEEGEWSNLRLGWLDLVNLPEERVLRRRRSRNRYSGRAHDEAEALNHLILRPSVEVSRCSTAVEYQSPTQRLLVGWWRKKGCGEVSEKKVELAS